MTTDTDGLVSRLNARMTVRDEFATLHPLVNPNGPEAAALITQQSATISRLTAELGEAREALGQIEAFTCSYFEPWGSWKTAWWEGEVSDDAAFSGDNALKHVANIAAKAQALASQGGSGS